MLTNQPYILNRPYQWSYICIHLSISERFPSAPINWTNNYTTQTTSNVRYDRDLLPSHLDVLFSLNKFLIISLFCKFSDRIIGSIFCRACQYCGGPCRCYTLLNCRSLYVYILWLPLTQHHDLRYFVSLYRLVEYNARGRFVAYAYVKLLPLTFVNFFNRLFLRFFTKNGTHLTTTLHYYTVYVIFG